MVAPVPAQISELRHFRTPRSRRISPLPAPHCPLSSSPPSSASRGVNIPPVLSSFRILPVATGVYPTTDLRIFRDANSFASYHIPATPAVSCNYALFCATARRYPSYSQQLPHSFCRHRGGTPVASVLRPPDPLCCAFSRSCSLCVFSNLQPLFFSLLSFCQPNSLFSIACRLFFKNTVGGGGLTIPPFGLNHTHTLFSQVCFFSARSVPLWPILFVSESAHSLHGGDEFGDLDANNRALAGAALDFHAQIDDE